MASSAPDSTAAPAIEEVALNAPFTDQKPGTSGLRKSSRQFEQPHYLESFIEAVFQVLPGWKAAPWCSAATAATATAMPST